MADRGEVSQPSDGGDRDGDGDGTGDSVRPPRIDFEAMYASTPGWDIDRPQPAFQALAAAGHIQGRVLDVGCGTGEHALMAAALGLEVVGVDAAPTAIAKAIAKAAGKAEAQSEATAEARDLSPSVRFVVADVLDLPSLDHLLDRQLGYFDTVVDCGLFHVFDDADRARFVDNLAALMPPGGRYFMLCFNEHQPGDWGPRRVTQAEIRESFADGWQIDSIEPARLVVTFLPDGVHAWLSSITRI